MRIAVSTDAEPLARYFQGFSSAGSSSLPLWTCESRAYIGIIRVSHSFKTYIGDTVAVSIKIGRKNGAQNIAK